MHSASCNGFIPILSSATGSCRGLQTSVNCAYYILLTYGLMVVPMALTFCGLWDDTSTEDHELTAAVQGIM
jgi:hypothetical protein